jgi:hypothetical protein
VYDARLHGRSLKLTSDEVVVVAHNFDFVGHMLSAETTKTSQSPAEEPAHDGAASPDNATN